MVKNPKFVMYKTDSGKFRFKLQARNGEPILQSQSYAGKDGCKNGIESVRKNGCDEACFELKDAKDGQFYFNLLAKNKQVIGTSEMYKTAASRANGVQAVIKVAQEAGVDDQT